jgi:hypothetical protein
MFKSFSIIFFSFFKILAFGYLSIMFSQSLYSQNNLIRNSSFEKYVNQNHPSAECAFSWYNPNNIQILNDWNGFLSPDLYNAAYAPNGCNVPHSYIGDSYAKHGNAFIGFIAFAGLGDTKEYIYQQLSTPLIADSTYCLSFFTSRADNITHSIHSIGAYFTSTLPSYGVYIAANPQIVNQNGFITDTTNWVEVQGCFTAQGGEQYITIGNFNSNANTDTLFVGTNTPIPYANKYAYYYIDSVTMYKNNLPTVTNEINKDRELKISPNPNNGVFEISFKNDEKCIIQIYNSLGQIIKQTPLQNFKTQFELNNEKEGVYFLNIRQNNLIIKQSKILIIK